jgi:hypothetical protein
MNGAADGGVMVRRQARVTVPQTPQMLGRAGMTTQAHGNSVLQTRKLKWTNGAETPAVSVANDDGVENSKRLGKLGKLGNSENLKR